MFFRLLRLRLIGLEKFSKPCRLWFDFFPRRAGHNVRIGNCMIELTASLVIIMWCFFVFFSLFPSSSSFYFMLRGSFPYCT